MRRGAIAVVLAVVILTVPYPPAAAAEKSRVLVGLGGSSVLYLPLYVAAELPPGADGLKVEVVTFQGGSQATVAVAGGSIDVGLASLDTLVGGVRAGQPLRAFYAGFNFAELEWFAQPSIRSWADMKGRAIGVSALGSLTDFLTRHVARGHGLEPGRDVQVVARGGPAVRWQALRSGGVDATVLPAPARWWAQAAGFTRLAVQSADVTREWPTNVMFARTDFLERHAELVRALLRVHVSALRLARADRERGIGALMRHLKLERPDAERMYAEAVDSFDERGALPASAMPIFWEIAVAAGEADAAWPEARFLDRRFIDAFDEWAPAR